MYVFHDIQDRIKTFSFMEFFLQCKPLTQKLLQALSCKRAELKFVFIVCALRYT